MKRLLIKVLITVAVVVAFLYVSFRQIYKYPGKISEDVERETWALLCRPECKLAAAGFQDVPVKCKKFCREWGDE